MYDFIWLIFFGLFSFGSLESATLATSVRVSNHTGNSYCLGGAGLLGGGGGRTYAGPKKWEIKE